jgi:hypothetical protein
MRNRSARVTAYLGTPKCDRYVATLGGESPSRALVRRTVREGKGAHREVGSEESRIQNGDLTNRKRIEAMALGEGRFAVQSPILTQKGPCRCDRLAGKCSELPGEICIRVRLLPDTRGEQRN